ncbi:MAG TPA: fimbrial protein [Buttiauxella sp.]|uniref:fimbrial protein n=1 Tax=Buttiauxella sp. TaxID=1972222 RepID=UPI002B492B99|nr:fimbrial protein [Buttiauxella sp.]HKM96466.1 fimbrial protein [Buttiauxella sp.]
MINYLKCSVTTPIILSVIILIFYSNISIAKDCELEGSLDPMISVSNTTPISFRAKVASTVELYRWDYDQNIYSRCGRGNDGNDIYTKRSSNFATVGSYSNKGLFETNIPGIVYSLQAETTGGSHPGGAISADSRELSWAGGSFDQLDDSKWRISIILYQMPSYNGVPTGISSIKLKQTGYIGYLRVGGEQHHAADITMVSMDVPIVVPTCTSLISSVGSGNVNLKDYDVADITNHKTEIVPFTLTASQCSNVTRFTTKLTTHSAYNGLLGNNSSASLKARGVGVYITAPNESQLLANNSNSQYVDTPGTMPGSRTFEYQAQLVATGESGVAVSAGEFKATGTFSLTYE